MIKEVIAKSILDSRRERTIQVIVKTEKGNFVTSAPAGKSIGKFEAKSYAKSLESDIYFLNQIKVKKINELKLKRFEDLKRIEKLVNGKIGANSLFAFEASLLKAIAAENKKELWNWLLGEVSPSKDGGNRAKFPRPIGNAIGGGLHSRGLGERKPDFQEFLFIANSRSFKKCVKINRKAYNIAGNFLKRIRKINDEGAFETSLDNEEVLNIMKKTQEIIKKKYNESVDIGIDVASSSFYKNGFYYYKNPYRILNKEKQMGYINHLIRVYKLFYVEDPMDEIDFKDFHRIEKKEKFCLIVGDDLTTTNPARVAKAIKMKSINAVIVKPNQIGSLLKVKEVIDMVKKNNVKTIISHRSGETMDNTIADLCVGFGCDFIKTGIYGVERRAKLDRLMRIERMVKK